MKVYFYVDCIWCFFLLNFEWIQKIICKGSDIFDMFLEEFIYKELISKLGVVVKFFFGVYMLKYLLENVEIYRYLLFGNCICDFLLVFL